MTQRHKDLARHLSATLAAQGIKLKHAHALHAVAAMHGLENWNQLAARPQTPMLEQEEAMQRLATRLAMYGVRNVQVTVLVSGSGFYRFLPEERANVGNMEGLFRAVTASLVPAEAQDEVAIPETSEVQGSSTDSFAQQSVAATRAVNPVAFEAMQHADPLVVTAGSPEGKIYWNPEPVREADLVPSDAPVLQHYPFGGGKSAATSLAVQEQLRHGDPFFFLGIAEPLERAQQAGFPRIDVHQVKPGQRVSVRADGQHGFMVERIFKRGWNRTLITDRGVPMDLHEDDDLYLLDTPRDNKKQADTEKPVSR